MLDIITKHFSELTSKELYELLQLRSEVFVVEQNCVYQDIDDKDQKAWHVMGFKEGFLVAYARIFKARDYFDKASIGRVTVSNEERKSGFGQLIMKRAIKVLEGEFKEEIIQISAQVYLMKFYKSMGFKTIGKEYLEDGIPHIMMVKEN